MEEKEKIEKALLKVALGFQVAEVTEEYAEVDGELKLTKRKKTKKDVPPDLKAVQLLLADGVGIEGMSDEQLQREKERLLAELGEAERGKVGLEKRGQVCVEKKKTATQTTANKTRKPPSKPRRRVGRQNKKDEVKK